VAILTGAGDKAFSAGNDLIYSGSGKPMCVPKNGFAGLTSRPHLPKPVIAAVNGFAMGGGCEIALACHLVVADETAKFALSEVKVGLIAGAGGVVRLPRTVPIKLADEILASSPTSVRISLAVMEETRGIPDVIDAVTHHSRALDDLMIREDALEGLTAFAQKRKPRWRNR
jgi:acetyl-CoA C-acetyltransferase